LREPRNAAVTRRPLTRASSARRSRHTAKEIAQEAYNEAYEEAYKEKYEVNCRMTILLRL